MKKLLFVCAFVMGISAVGFAQGGGPQGTPEERAAASLERPNMAAYNFTADQKTKVLAILVKQNKSSDSLRTAATAGGADPQTAFQTLGPKLAPISAANEAAIVALLTPDQKKTYDAALATAKERNPATTTAIIRSFGGGRRGGGGNGGGGGAPAGGN
jgi:protein CpxP